METAIICTLCAGLGAAAAVVIIVVLGELLK